MGMAMLELPSLRYEAWGVRGTPVWGVAAAVTQQSVWALRRNAESIHGE